MSSRSSMYRDSRWQKKRLEVLERDEWKCEMCGANGDGVELHVHHWWYESGKKPWEYEDGAMSTLCSGCHDRRHELARAWEELAVGLSNTELACALQLASRFFDIVRACSPAGSDAAAAAQRVLAAAFELAAAHYYAGRSAANG